jgi:hypothetical protein
MHQLRVFPKVAQVYSTSYLHVFSFVASGLLRVSVFKLHSNSTSVCVLIGPFSYQLAFFLLGVFIIWVALTCASWVNFCSFVFVVFTIIVLYHYLLPLFVIQSNFLLVFEFAVFELLNRERLVVMVIYFLRVVESCQVSLLLSFAVCAEVTYH